MEFGLVATWLATFLLLGVLARPVAAWLLPGIDHDAFAIPVALAILAVIGHLVGHLAFGWPAILAGLGVLAGIAYWAWDGSDLFGSRFVEAAVVFTAAFLFIVGIRALEPAAAPLPVAIGEKMLDFGLVKSLLRAPRLPPEDMWFAGRPVRYHYGGHMLTALLATMTGTAGRFTYNLALAGFYASLVVAAYGLGGSIALVYDVPRRSAAAFAAFLVGVAGNLATPARVVAWLLPDGFAAWLATQVGADPSVAAWTPADFFYFEASRVIPLDPTNPNSFMAATEFPLFAWLNGDLHAHMMSQPFLLLIGAVLLAYWRAAAQPRRRVGLLFGALPPLVGFIGVVNVWSFPTAVALTLLAVAFAPGEPTALLPSRVVETARLGSLPRPRNSWLVEEVRRLGMAVLATVGVALLGIGWTLPYWTGVVLGGPGLSPGLWAPWTPFGGFVLAQGAFLAVLGVYLVAATAITAETPRLLWAGGLAVFGIIVLLGAPALAFVLPLGLGAWLLLRADPEAGYEWLFVLAGAGLVILVEFVTVEGERFNTVFKYYAHVWLFWSVAGGVALARLRAGWPGTAVEFSRLRWEAVGRALAVVVVVSTAAYAGFALPAHVDDPGPAVKAGGPTLDATAYVEVRFPTEAPAIRWLDAREGRPVIVSAAAGRHSYWWRPARGDGSAAPASLTGLPTVLGWFHERQYRGPDAYNERLEHVRELYVGDPARQRALLDRYGVRYVYVGPAEQARYGDVTVDDLDAVTVAAQWDGVTVYRVDRTAL